VAGGAAVMAGLCAPADAWGPTARTSMVTAAAHVLGQDPSFGLSRLARYVNDGASIPQADFNKMYPLYKVDPVGAIQKLLASAGWSVADVDLFEVNEAFACVAMFAMHDLGIPHDKVNVNGGATALGHPIGASGARIITTLVAALKARGLKKGVASLCIGGGEATAVALERYS